MTVYLTYWPNIQCDGAGAQLQRILSAYSVASCLGIGYIHTPLQKVGYFGLHSLAANAEEKDCLEKWNTMFELKDLLAPPENADHVFITALFWTNLAPILYKAKSTGKSTILHTANANGMIDDYPPLINPFLDNPAGLFPWVETQPNSSLQIDVHIRRGDLWVSHRDRLLPNSYYIGVIKTLSSMLHEEKLAFEIHIHSENLNKPTVITSTHRGVEGRLDHDIVLDPSDNHWDDFKDLPDIQWHFDEDPRNTIKKMANSDFLVISHSSFSYIAGMLNKKGLILYHPFWHKPLKNWCICGDDGAPEALTSCRLILQEKSSKGKNKAMDSKT